MIVLQPDCQLVCWDDWQLVTNLLRDQHLAGIRLVEVFAVGQSGQVCSAFRMTPVPLSLHATLADAQLAGEGVRQGEQAFEIDRLPAIQLDFGRYSLMLTLSNSQDYAGFMQPAAQVEGNVLRLPRFTPSERFISALSFRDLHPMLSSRLAPGQMLFSCMGLAVTQATWAAWKPDGCVRWASRVLHDYVCWLESSFDSVSTDFAAPFVAQACRDFQHLRNRGAEHGS